MTSKDTKSTKVTKPTPKRGSKAPKILAIAASHPELTTREIGKLADCSHVNVIETLQRYKMEPEAVKRLQDNKVNVLTGLQEKIINSLTDADFEKESIHSRIVDAGIIQDKIRDILNGHAGGNGVHVTINVGDPAKVIDVTADPS